MQLVSLLYNHRMSCTNHILRFGLYSYDDAIHKQMQSTIFVITIQIEMQNTTIIDMMLLMVVIKYIDLRNDDRTYSMYEYFEEVESINVHPAIQH